MELRNRVRRKEKVRREGPGLLVIVFLLLDAIDSSFLNDLFTIRVRVMLFNSLFTSTGLADTSPKIDKKVFAQARFFGKKRTKWSVK